MLFNRSVEICLNGLVVESKRAKEQKVGLDMDSHQENPPQLPRKISVPLVIPDLKLR